MSPPKRNCFIFCYLPGVIWMWSKGFFEHIHHLPFAVPCQLFIFPYFCAYHCRLNNFVWTLFEISKQKESLIHASHHRTQHEIICPSKIGLFAPIFKAYFKLLHLFIKLHKRHMARYFSKCAGTHTTSKVDMACLLTLSLNYVH